MNCIEFEKVMIDPATNSRRDGVAVIRNGTQVALLPEFDRVRRALSLSLESVQQVVNEFSAIMHRAPTPDEKEFWRAVSDFKRSQQQECSTGATNPDRRIEGYGDCQ